MADDDMEPLEDAEARHRAATSGLDCGQPLYQTLATAVTDTDDRELIALLRRWQPSFGALKLAADRLDDLAAQLAAARTVTDRLLGGWEWDPMYVPEGFVGPGGYWVHPNGDICPPAPGEAAWLAGSTEPSEQHAGMSP